MPKLGSSLLQHVTWGTCTYTEYTYEQKQVKTRPNPSAQIFFSLVGSNSRNNMN